ncbi:hypothetical protein HUU05_21735 [candidate division KSB1 bacterium]|nr:hypothetical protein [candidate division KSB1 bacterium]
MTALASAFKLWKQEPDVFTISLLALGLGAVLVSLSFVRFKKQPNKTSTTHGERTQSLAYSPRARRWALIGLIAVPFFTFAGVATWFYIRSLPSTKVRVLIAEFDGPEPKKYRVTENILRRLREATSKYDDVEIEALAEVITEQQGSKVAREKGKDKKASIVLWGWYAATGVQAQITVHFEVPKELMNLPLPKAQQTLIVALGQLETFAIQTRLSREMSYLTLVTLGFIRFEAEDYDAAISFFSDAETQVDSPQERIQPVVAAYLYLARASASLRRKEWPRASAELERLSKLLEIESRLFDIELRKHGIEVDSTSK